MNTSADVATIDIIVHLHAAHLGNPATTVRLSCVRVFDGPHMTIHFALEEAIQQEQEQEQER